MQATLRDEQYRTAGAHACWPPITPYRTLVEEDAGHARLARTRCSWATTSWRSPTAMPEPTAKLVGILARCAQPRLRVADAVDRSLLAQAGGARPADCLALPTR
jgi:hypothetical protein